MRTVLVTGASTGIGAAVAQRFAAAGDRVVIHYATNRAGAEGTLKSLPGKGHVLVSGDIGDPEGALQIMASAVEKGGPLMCSSATPRWRLRIPTATSSANPLIRNGTQRSRTWSM